MNTVPVIRDKAGFTLIEMVIAVAIFSVIAIAVYSSTVRFAEVKAELDRRTDQLASINKAFLLLERDLRYAAPRQVRREYGDWDAIFHAYLPDSETDGKRILFEATVFLPNYSEPELSTLHRVGWQKDGDSLQRFVWPVLDRAQDTKPEVKTILTDVAQVQVQYYKRDTQGKIELVDEWLNGIRPPGVRLQLTMQDSSSFVRIFDGYE